MSKSKNLFIFLSLAIALIDILFISINYVNTRDTLQTTIHNDSQKDYIIYQTLLESTYKSLSRQATLLADDERLQKLFLLGKKTLKLEGGDSGGAKTAIHRKKLYQLIAPVLHNADQKFGLHHLHFHLGPEAISFLRVHQPDKFGDRQDELRFLIVDTNAQQSPRSGFETGRVFSELRAAVPVFSWDQEFQKKVYVGVLELSTSYKKILQTINHNFMINTSILLNRQHIEETIWDEYISGNYKNNTIKGCDCLLEASSNPDQKILLEYIAKKSGVNPSLSNIDGQTKIIVYNNHSYAITFYPFRDYLGTKIPSRKDIGAVFISRNIDDLFSSYEDKQLVNILFGIFAYLVVELLLIFTFVNVTKLLTEQVAIQTQILSDQKYTIELDKIRYKTLADAINDSYFFYTRNNKNKLSFVSPSITQVLGFSQEDFLIHIAEYLPQKASMNYTSNAYKHSINTLANNFELEIYNKSGRLQHLLVTETAKYDESNELVQVEGFAQDISATRRNTMLLKLRCEILEQIIEKRPQDEILNNLALGVEDIITDIHCSIMLFDGQSNKLKIGAAPNLPAELINFLNTIDINLDNDISDNAKHTACTIAIKTLKRKIIPDLQLSSGGNSASELLEQTIYKSTCSEPILSTKAKVLATIDLYYHQIGKPNESDLQVITSVTDMVSILLEPQEIS